MGRYRAVLFGRDARPHPNTCLAGRRGPASVGRTDNGEAAGGISERVDAALKLPEWGQAERCIDLSADLHRTATLWLFEKAGLDQELAEALYRVEWEPDSRLSYPDVVDFLGAVHARGAKIAVVSDIHFDVRPDCTAHGIDLFVDARVLSSSWVSGNPIPGCS